MWKFRSSNNIEKLWKMLERSLRKTLCKVLWSFTGTSIIKESDLNSNRSCATLCIWRVKGSINFKCNIVTFVFICEFQRKSFRRLNGQIWKWETVTRETIDHKKNFNNITKISTKYMQMCARTVQRLGRIPSRIELCHCRSRPIDPCWIAERKCLFLSLILGYGFIERNIKELDITARWSTCTTIWMQWPYSCREFLRTCLFLWSSPSRIRRFVFDWGLISCRHDSRTFASRIMIINIWLQSRKRWRTLLRCKKNESRGIFESLRKRGKKGLKMLPRKNKKFLLKTMAFDRNRRLRMYCKMIPKSEICWRNQSGYNNKFKQFIESITMTSKGSRARLSLCFFAIVTEIPFWKAAKHKYLCTICSVICWKWLFDILKKNVLFGLFRNTNFFRDELYVSSKGFKLRRTRTLSWKQSRGTSWHSVDCGKKFSSFWLTEIVESMNNTKKSSQRKERRI